MFFAINLEGEKIHIDNAITGKEYFCPVCGQEVMQKKGLINAYHYAHKSREKCDSWSYDMSPWHREWQSKFPDENQEVVIEYNGEKHRADILINNTVIEFQHSKISNDEFLARNNFYKSAGYNLIWVFDLVEEYEFGRITRSEDDDWKYKWGYRWHTFDNFLPQENKSVQIYLQLYDDVSISCIEKMNWLQPNGGIFFTKTGVAYDQSEFLEMFIDIEKGSDENNCIKELTIADVQDTIFELHNYYYPCLMNARGCEVFENCDCCIYSIRCIDKNSIGKKYVDLYRKRENNFYTMRTSGCLYRFRDILDTWDDQKDKVKKVMYDDEGKVLELVLLKSGQEIIRKYDKVDKIGMPLVDLLRITDANVIGVKNIKSGKRVKIGNRYYFNNTSIKKVFGYIGIDSSIEYYPDRREIYGVNEPYWIIEWQK